MLVSKQFVILILVFLLVGCASENILTEEELKLQNAVDYEVASILFDKNMSDTASYKIHHNGVVVIVFDKSVPHARYNDVVTILRSSKVIKGVRAEQEGHEVCPLRR